MIKNIIIAIQFAILAFVAIWAHLYQHRMEQIFISRDISSFANEARFKVSIANRIKSGQTDDAERMLRNVAATNVKWAKETITELDLRMEDLASDAEKSAMSLDEIGVPDLKNALQARKAAANR